MIDQEQARKFWTNWVRREIGGNDLVQEAAVSAAVNEILQGRDNQAAADAARRTAQSLGIGVPAMTASPSAAPTRNAPFPAPAVASAAPGGKDRQPPACQLCCPTPAANRTHPEH